MNLIVSRLRLVFVLLITIVAFKGSAQVRGVGDFIPPDAVAGNDSISNESERDSFLYDYIMLDDIDASHVYSDTTLGNYFDQYDPSRKRDFDYLTIGNLGGAHMSSIYDPIIKSGFYDGFDQYSLYNKSLADFKYYDVNRPLADLGFFPLIGQEGNFMVSADVGQTFKDGVSLAINYDRIVQDGLYSNQKVKHTNVGIGFRKKTKGEKLNTFLTAISNVNTEQNNGGITTDTLFGFSTYSDRTNYPTHIDGASTRHDHNIYSLQNVYRFGDTIADASDVLVTHRLNYENKVIKFADVNVSQNGSYYNDLAVDDRGVRYFLKYSTISNALFLQNSGEQKIHGRIGLQHDFIKIRNGALTSKRNDLTALAEGVLPIKNIFELNLNGSLGLGSNAGRFSIDGNMDFVLKKYLRINLGTNFFNAEQSYISKFVVINDNLIYQRPGSFSIGNKIYATLKIPITKTEVGVRQTIINNPIYWDNNFKSKQKDGVLSHSVLKIDQKIKVGSFHFDNSGFVQLLSDSIYNLPKWFTKHSLYLNRKIFKKVMEIKTGFDLRLIPNYIGNSYSPVVGQFYTDPEANLKLYPYADFFLMAKVSSFRLFFRLENITDYFTEDVHFQINNYPFSDSQIRFGVRWQMLD